MKGNGQQPAATLGLTLYINSEASLSLIRALLDNGMSQGAALVVGVLWIGAMVCGFAFDPARCNDQG